MNIFQASFSSSQVAPAAGISNDVLQNWLRSDRVVEDADGPEGGGSQGRHRRYSFRSVMQISSAAALIDCGVSRPHAFQAAQKFAFTGGDAFLDIPARLPGLPFDNSAKNGIETLLCCHHDQSYVVAFDQGKIPYRDIRQTLGGAISFTLLNVNELFDRVCRELKYHPEEVMELAYSGSAIPS